MKCLMNTILATLIAAAPAAATGTGLPDLQKAIDAAQPGDVIQLDGGVYAGPFTIPAGKDGLVLQGPATLVAGGRPCTQGTPPDALLKVEAERVHVQQVRVCGDAAGPKAGIVATGAGLWLDGVTVQGVPGDAVVLLAPGALVQGCTLSAAAGTAVVLAQPGTDDPPICTWGGPLVHDLLDAAGGLVDTLAGTAGAHRTVSVTTLADNLILDVVAGVRVLGGAAGELRLHDNEIDAQGPALIVDPAPGAFQVFVRGRKPGTAWLAQDATGATIELHARAAVFMLRYAGGTAYVSGASAAKPAVDLVAGPQVAGKPTLKLAGTFFGDTPTTQQDVDVIAIGTQAPGLSGQAAP